MLKTFLVNGWGAKFKAKVSEEGALHVIQHVHPPRNENVQGFPYRQYFTTNGTSTGSIDMRVNGATTNQEFYISADGRDRYIKTIHITLADAGATLAKFGNLTALTNGLLFKWFSNDIGDIEIYDGIKTNLAFWELTDREPVIIDLSGSGADANIVPIDLGKLFGNKFGLRLRAGSTDRLSFVVRDNLSVGIDRFDIVGYGQEI